MAGRPDHLRDPAAGADRAAARSRSRSCARAARSSCSRATLRDADGEALIRAPAWRLAERAIEIPPGPAAGRRARCPAPSAAEDEAVLRHRPGGRLPHGDGVPVRRGAFRELGPATVWMRMRHPLVAGEEPTPLQRVLAAADSGNGVSATLDLARYLFINVDLSVHLHRLPAGEWVCLDAITVPRAERDRARRHGASRRAGPDRPRAADAARPRARACGLRSTAAELARSAR